MSSKPNNLKCPVCNATLIETLPREDHPINTKLQEIPLLCCPNNIKKKCSLVGMRMTIDKTLVKSDGEN